MALALGLPKVPDMPGQSSTPQEATPEESTELEESMPEELAALEQDLGSYLTLTSTPTLGPTLLPNAFLKA